MLQNFINNLSPKTFNLNGIRQQKLPQSMFISNQEGALFSKKHSRLFVILEEVAISVKMSSCLLFPPQTLQSFYF